MTGHEFHLIRLCLGLTQRQLALVLGYRHPIRISEFERATRPLPVPVRVAAQMRAFAAGYRPADWPERRQRRSMAR